MYKVVIVDDEPVILEGLKKIIPWEDFSCRVVGQAEDGVKGMELIRRLRPDILFTDIKMPNLDGLAMVAGLRQSFPAMEIAVLTAHRDFEYAQQAIRLGVTRYLLKPSKMNELLEALTVMTENLRQASQASLPGQPSQPGESPEAPSQSPEGAEDSSGSFVVRNLVKYIEEHYAEKLSLKEAAEKVYVSQWHLSKLLKKHLDKNFLELLHEVRVTRAKQLLHDPSLKIHDISALVGFTDVTHFSKIFKKCEGRSANEYRNSL